MEISNNILSLIAEETNVSLYHVQRYYDILNGIPCVYDGNKYQLLNCLYLLINLRKENMCPINASEFYYLLSDALYKTYKEESIPYLSIFYIDVNNLFNDFNTLSYEK